MIWTTFVLLIGIYIGQEFDVVPSIKLIGLALLNNIKDFQDNSNEAKQDNNIFTKFWEIFIKSKNN